MKWTRNLSFSKAKQTLDWLNVFYSVGHCVLINTNKRHKESQEEFGKAETRNIHIRICL